MKVGRSFPPAHGRWFALLFVLSALGCSGGDSLQPVQGKVLYKDQPAKGVVVSFHPTASSSKRSETSVGVAGEDGSFTLSTGQKTGAPPGEYVVTFIWPEEVLTKPARKFAPPPEPETRDRLQGTYANPKTSQFKVQIKAGDHQLEPYRLK
jgi:hypothetical protein